MFPFSARPFRPGHDAFGPPADGTKKRDTDNLAIIGISYGFMTFSGNMMGVSVTGTSVKIEKCVDDL